MNPNPHRWNVGASQQVKRAPGILATPANSFINELVTQSARLSIARDGQPAVIEYEPTPKIRLRA